MPFVRPAILAGLLLAAIPPQALSQVADTTRLSDLVVTATRLETPRTSLPASVSVVTGEELARRGFRFVADWLKELPGAAVVETGSFGSVTSLFLRGGESDYVKLLVDGVGQPAGLLAQPRPPQRHGRGAATSRSSSSTQNHELTPAAFGERFKKAFGYSFG